MKYLFKTRIGIPNTIAIIVITAITGFLSVFSLMSIDQLNAMRAHWAQALLGRLGILMGVSQAMTGLLLICNVMYAFATRETRVKNKFIAIFLRAAILCFLTAFIGTSILLLN